MLSSTATSLAMALLLCVAATAAAAAAPQPPIWGGGMQWSVTVNVTDATSAPYTPWTFKYEYNSLINASRLTHGAGQHDEMCTGQFTGAAAGAPCTVTHATDGWSYVAVGNECCKCSPDVGIVNPRWLSNPNARYLGQSTVDGRPVNGWVEAGVSAQDNTYYAAVADDRPVQFFEHKSGKLKTWDFDLDTYHSNAPASEALAPPADCQARCKSFICRI